MDSPDFHGPGLLFVKARISRPDILSEETYMKWYDEDHIAEIIQTSGIKSAFRYIRSDKDSIRVKENGVLEEYPYLALYPMDDIAFLKSEEFVKGIRVKSGLLPGSGVVYDLADNEVRYYKLRERRGDHVGRMIEGDLGEKEEGKGKGLGRVIIPAQFDGEGEGLRKWVEEEHIEEVKKLDGYLKSTIFELVFSRTNAESRKLKGLPVVEGDEKGEEGGLPRWLCVHEFERDLDRDVVEGLEREGGGKGGKVPVYRVAKVHGRGEWFHETR